VTSDGSLEVPTGSGSSGAMAGNGSLGVTGGNDFKLLGVATGNSFVF